MKVKREYIPNTIKFLQIDLPELVLETAIIEDTDEYWRQVIELCERISKKYPKDKFARHMVLAYLGYLDEQYKNILNAKESKMKQVQGRFEENEKRTEV